MEEKNWELWKRKGYCPCLLGEGNFTQCNKGVVKNVSTNYCNSKNFESCSEFAKNYGGLKKPFEWLQMKAVESIRKEDEK